MGTMREEEPALEAGNTVEHECEPAARIKPANCADDEYQLLSQPGNHCETPINKALHNCCDIQAYAADWRLIILCGKRSGKRGLNSYSVLERPPKYLVRGRRET